MPQVHVADDRAAWVQMAARFIAGAAQQALADEGRFVLALSGGSTPRPVYRALPGAFSALGLTWQRVHILWSDERCVPLDHPLSNYRMAHESLIAKIEIPPENIHPLRCDHDPSTSAATYESNLRNLYPDQAWPTIDLVLLGLGGDGHTASLFPSSPALSEQARWVVPNEVPGLDMSRMTFTIPAINAARRIAFLVAGSDKAGMVRRVMAPLDHQPPVPAQAIEPSDGELHWLLDSKAAGELAGI